MEFIIFIKIPLLLILEPKLTCQTNDLKPQVKIIVVHINKFTKNKFKRKRDKKVKKFPINKLYVYKNNNDELIMNCEGKSNSVSKNKKIFFKDERKN